MWAQILARGVNDVPLFCGNLSKKTVLFTVGYTSVLFARWGTSSANRFVCSLCLRQTQRTVATNYFYHFMTFDFQHLSMLCFGTPLHNREEKEVHQLWGQAKHCVCVDDSSNSD